MTRYGTGRTVEGRAREGYERPQSGDQAAMGRPVDTGADTDNREGPR